MKIERNYIGELSKAFKSDDEKQIEETINDFYYEFYEAIDTENEDKYYEIQNKLVGLIHKKIISDGEFKYRVYINYSEINEDLLGFIVFPFWNKLRQKFDKEILEQKSLIDPGENKGMNLLTEMNYSAENIFYRHAYEYCEKKLIDKHTIQFIEDRMKDLSNLIMIGRENISNKNKDNNNETNSDLFIKKFRGNSIQKRKSGNQEKYSKVAKIIKVAEEHFPQLKLTQTTACEMAECNSFSFARWKNYSKNYDMFLDWQKKIGAEEANEIKNEIMNYFKLHSDM
jgi:hypothetical protein